MFITAFGTQAGNIEVKVGHPSSSELHTQQRMSGRVILGQISASTHLEKAARRKKTWLPVRSGVISLLYSVVLHICKYCIGSVGQIWLCILYEVMCSVFKSLIV
ncbi:hypothetical protein ILYODFUR_010350 [Ilyodon furcidens]|uniref:Uncharacterized protein n=1 Tax=Ilyodon furcidens TaxID=33524 RepID=A0ABV0V4S8_9TELE